MDIRARRFICSSQLLGLARQQQPCTDHVWDPNKVNLSLMWVGTFFGLLSGAVVLLQQTLPIHVELSGGNNENRYVTRRGQGSLDLTLLVFTRLQEY